MRFWIDAAGNVELAVSNFLDGNNASYTRLFGKLYESVSRRCGLLLAVQAGVCC